jgi:very-short-patch-repair endonuclease
LRAGTRPRGGIIRLVAARKPAFRRKLAAAGACDELLAIGDERRKSSIDPRDCDEILVGDRAIAALAARQCGVVTTGQLEVAGLTRNAVAYRVANGRLTPVHRGVYQVGPIAAPHGREMAAVLATGGVLSHHTAAAIWGIRPPHDGDVHVTTTKAARSRNGVRVHRSASLDAAVHNGLPLTTAARTLHDLAALLPRRELERAVEEAEIRRLVARDELRPALRRTDEPQFTRSEAERRLVELIRAAGLPAPLTNVTVAGYEVDCFWPRHKLVVEVDGYAFHGGRAAFERDRRKTADLAAAGLTPVRVTWWQIAEDAHRLVSQLTRLLPP